MKNLYSCKIIIQKAVVLTHFDEKLPVIVTSDASSKRVSTVLNHVLPKGTESPIAYHSRTLSKPERSYSQTHR